MRLEGFEPPTLGSVERTDENQQGDTSCLSIESIPDQFCDPRQGRCRLREPVEVIGIEFDVEALGHSHDLYQTCMSAQFVNVNSVVRHRRAVPNDLASALESFAKLLSQRLDLRVATTEDSIRYTFFAALLTSGLEPYRVVLEFPHLEIKGARVDTVILDEKFEPSTAIEFKYDRRNPGGTNQPLPLKAGSAFADLGRLAKLPESQTRLFVHVMDGELSRYLASPRNGLNALFNLREGSELIIDAAFLNGRSPTFMGRIGTWPNGIRVRCLTSLDLPNEHFLRIYQIVCYKSAFNAMT